MGLLDMFGTDAEDPRSQAIMALSAGLINGTPQGISQGLLSASGAFGQQKEKAQRARLLDAQIGDVEAQATGRRQEAAMQQRQLQLAMAKQQMIPKLFGADGQFNVPAAVQAGFTPDEIAKYAGLKNAGRDKVARTVDTIGPDGRPVTMQMDEFGRPVGDAAPQWKAPTTVDNGAFIFNRDTVTGQMTPISAKMQSPDSVAAQAAPKYHDGAWITPPNTQNPQGTMTPTAAYMPPKGSPQALAQGANKVLGITGEMRGLLDNATGSYLGAGFDQVARVFGSSTDGAKTTAKLQTLAGQLVASMPRMEGPQSDKDVALLREMAGNLADPTSPIETRKAALDQIEALQQKYATPGMATSQSPAAPAVAGKPTAGKTFKDYGYDNSAAVLQDARNTILRNPKAQAEVERRLAAIGLSLKGGN